jgi:hypothetical protein
MRGSSSAAADSLRHWLKAGGMTRLRDWRAGGERALAKPAPFRSERVRHPASQELQLQILNFREGSPHHPGEEGFLDCAAGRARRHEEKASGRSARNDGERLTAAREAAKIPTRKDDG